MDSPCYKPIQNIFHSSLNLETTHFNDGSTDGLIAGKQEAKDLGLKLGFEIGQELRFYRGCLDARNSAIGVDRGSFSSRVRKNIRDMEEIVERYPVWEPENESVQDLMHTLRLKFRAVCATLPIHLEYEGYPGSSESTTIDF